MTFDSVTLEGWLVRLEPLSCSHKEGLCEATEDGELWKLPVTLTGMNRLSSKLAH